MARAARAKLTRAERNEDVRNRLFHAAAEIVGERGYAEASIARITDRAGVALGTFYLHFENRQALLDELLPTIGQEMKQYVVERIAGVRPAGNREMASFRAFFQYMTENPAFLRILNEAEFAAPLAFRQHLDEQTNSAVKQLMISREEGDVNSYSDGELEAVLHILMGARTYLSRRLGLSAQTNEVIFSAYEKLLRNGLFPNWSD